MVGNMAIALALRGFSDLGYFVAPTFLSRNRLYLQSDLHIAYAKNEQKLSLRSKKNFKISVNGTSNPAILPLQGA